MQIKIFNHRTRGNKLSHFDTACIVVNKLPFSLPKITHYTLQSADGFYIQGHEKILQRYEPPGLKTLQDIHQNTV